MKNVGVMLILALTPACLMRVQLGSGASAEGPAAAGDDEQKQDDGGGAPVKPTGTDVQPAPELRVKDFGVAIDEVTPARMARAASGDVFIAADDALFVAGRSSVSKYPYDPSDGGFASVRAIAALSESVLLATDAGTFVCELDDDRARCKRASEHDGPSVVGFAPMPGGKVLFASEKSVGVLKASAPFLTPPVSLTTERGVAGTTRAWQWLRFDAAPWACALDRPPQAGQSLACVAKEKLSAKVTQVVAIDEATIAFATLGDGVLLRGKEADAWDESNGLPDGHVNDLIVWQDDLWAATESGLARLDPKNGARDVPESVLAGQAVVALAIGGDGALLAAVGRQPSKLVRFSAK